MSFIGDLYPWSLAAFPNEGSVAMKRSLAQERPAGKAFQSQLKLFASIFLGHISETCRNTALHLLQLLCAAAHQADCQIHELLQVGMKMAACPGPITERPRAGQSPFGAAQPSHTPMPGCSRDNQNALALLRGDIVELSRLLACFSSLQTSIDK